MSKDVIDAQKSNRAGRTNRTRRRILVATASAGTGSLIVPTVSAQEDPQNETENEDLPDWFSENPENEVKVVEVYRKVPSSSGGLSIQGHGDNPELVLGETVSVGGRTIGVEITVYDVENAACNWGMEIGVGVVSASGKRIHCEGDNALTVSPGPASVTLAAEPLRDGTTAEEGLTVTGEVCVGAWIAEVCESVSWDLEFP